MSGSDGELMCGWSPRRTAALANGMRLCEGCEEVIDRDHALCGFCRQIDAELEERRKRLIAAIHDAEPVKGRRPDQPRMQMGLGPADNHDDLVRAVGLTLFGATAVACWVGLIWAVRELIAHWHGGL